MKKELSKGIKNVEKFIQRRGENKRNGVENKPGGKMAEGFQVRHAIPISHNVSSPSSYYEKQFIIHREFLRSINRVDQNPEKYATVCQQFYHFCFQV